MTSVGQLLSTLGMPAPPYPAALTITGPSWRSPLAYNGRVALARPSIQLGRMEGNDVVLGDPLVSRYHAVIRWTPAGYEIEDLGSANGTTVMGQRIAGCIPLAPGQTIQMGTTGLVFDVFDAERLPSHSELAHPIPNIPGVLGAAPHETAPAPAATVIAPHLARLGAPGPVSLPSAYTGAAVGYGGRSGHPFYDLMARRQQSPLALFAKTEWPKSYWRIFLLGLAAYLVVTQVLVATQNLHLVPLELMLASALVPAVFVIFCFEQNAFADMPFGVVSITFMSGAILGLTIAGVLEPLLLPTSIGSGSAITFSAALLIAVCEESAKVVSVVWFLRDKRLRSELDGLILGAAAGMGFAALETAGYGFVAFLAGFTHSLSANPSTVIAINQGIHQMNQSLMLRMALAVFGHGVWTAIVCAAIWRDRRQATFRLTLGVVLAFSIAVILHALWDWSPLTAYLAAGTNPFVVLLVVFGWFLFIGGLGLFFLSFFLRESLRRAKLGPAAPPPPPLLQAILLEILQPFKSRHGLQPGYTASLSHQARDSGYSPE
ncbi:MAG: PrsW family glutamic-type intramembrane protease [Ktedonobacterales bacterium]